MSDAWVYIDESQAPHAAGTEAGQPFWLAALVTKAPIDDALVQAALNRLRDDPDAVGHASDQATLGRGYFHASADSKNAHSALCSAIVAAGLDATFLAAQWFFEREDGDKYEGARLHRLSALLGVSSVFQDDFDCVHVVLARRERSFATREVEEWPAYCARTQRDGVVHGIYAAAFPVRFPRIDASLADADHPGIQVCDFVLWCVQRARLERLEPTGDARWLRYLGLHLGMAGGVEGSASQEVRGQLGGGAELTVPGPDHPVPPRDIDELSDEERWELVKEIAADVHRAARIATGNSRIGHFAELLKSAASACDRNEAREDNGKTFADLMEVFVHVCDTLPVYDTTDALAFARATEKRALAASFLRPGCRLWVPDGFSLKAEDLLPEAHRKPG
jgi:hypothetical protein